MPASNGLDELAACGRLVTRNGAALLPRRCDIPLQYSLSAAIPANHFQRRLGAVDWVTVNTVQKQLAAYPSFARDTRARAREANRAVLNVFGLAQRRRRHRLKRLRPRTRCLGAGLNPVRDPPRHRKL